MPRNLVRRVELLTGIKDEAAKEKIIQILQPQSSDNMLAHELQSDGTYVKVKHESSRMLNNHKFLEDYVNRVAKSAKKMSTSDVQSIANRLFMEN